MTATTSKGVLCGNCANYHPSALDVQACYGQAAFQAGQAAARQSEPERWTGSNTANSPLQHGKPAQATQKQLDFIRRLQEDKGLPVEDLNLTKREASQVINDLKALPNTKGTVKADIAKVKHGEWLGDTGLQRGGIHVVDGRYFRVHQSQRTGNLYACVWNGQGFDYDAGAIKRLTPANRATAEQAAAFGTMTGQCCFCAKAIDTPESVAVGYGPICAGKFGLPWGDTTIGPVAV